MDPFIGTEAIAAGLVNRYQLRTRFGAVYRNVYMPRGQLVTPRQRAKAAWLWSRREATVVGLSAAALYGTRWIDARLPAELNQRSQHKTRGISLTNERLACDEKRTLAGIPLTTPARTAFDIGRRYGRTLAVIRLDALMRVTDLKPDDVDVLIEVHRGARGLHRLRTALSLVDAGAESPQETRTRLILTDAGLRPQRAQIKVFDKLGLFIGRVDMGWDDWRVGVEYDGAQHWTDPAVRARDIERQAELEAVGWRIVRVSADMLRYRPATIVSRVRAALQAAGAPV